MVDIKTEIIALKIELPGGRTFSAVAKAATNISTFLSKFILNLSFHRNNAQLNPPNKQQTKGSHPSLNFSPLIYAVNVLPCFETGKKHYDFFGRKAPEVLQLSGQQSANLAS